MSIKGFQSVKHQISQVYSSTTYELKQFFATLSQLDYGAGLDTVPRYLVSLGSGTTTNPQPSFNKKRIVKITGHSLLAGYVIRFTSGVNVRREIQVSQVLDVDHVLLAGELLNDAGDGETFDYYKYGTPLLDSSSRLLTVDGALDVVDHLDTDIIDVNTTTIPRSTSAPLTVVANLAATSRKIRTNDTLGYFIGVYLITAGPTYTLKTILGPGGSERECSINSGSVIGIRHMLDTDIDAVLFPTAGEGLFIMEFFG